MFARTILAILLSQALFLTAVFSQVDVTEFDGLSTKEATAKLLLMPAQERDETLKLLLKSTKYGQRGMAADVVKSIYALHLLGDLMAAEQKEIKHQRVRSKMQNAIETLTLYAPIAVEDLEVAVLTAESASAMSDEVTMGGLFTPAAVDVLVAKDDGTPFQNGSVQAFSEDYGILEPFGEFKKTDRSGHATFDIFPGKWTFFAFDDSEGAAFYLCISGVKVGDGDTVTLKPTTPVTVDFRAEGGKPVDVDEVLIVDSAFSDFIQPVSMGRSVRGKFRFLTAGKRPLDITAARQPEGKTGILLHAGWRGGESNIQMSAEKKGCVEFVFAGSQGPSKIREAEITLAPRCLSKTKIRFTGTLPMSIVASPGAMGVTYSYQTEDGYTLVFAPRGYSLPKGSSKRMELGGPYECSIFHQFYKNYARQKNKLAYYLFVRDLNDHLLRLCKGTGRQRRGTVTIPLKVTLDGKLICDTSRDKPTKQLASIAGSIPDAESLEGLEYEVGLPFAPGKTYSLKGHRADFRKSSEHFNFEGPSELSYNADNWLKGSELLFDAFSDLLGHTPKWANSKAGIQFRCKMPPGYGAYASAGGVTFTIGAGETMIHPRRMLDVALRHELLHRFGYGHRDHMGVTCREVAVRMYGDNPAPRLRRKEDGHTEMLKCMRGEAVVRPDAVIAQMLLARYSHDLFNDYKQKGCPKRNRLLADGLSETETDCAIFAFYGGDEVVDIFRATGIAMDESNVERGLALLAADGSEGSAEVSETAGGPKPRSKAARAHYRAKRLCEQGKVDEALREMKTAAACAEQIPNHRQRAALFCRMGETLFQNGEKEDSYEMLKACQKAAARVDYTYLNTARRICLDVLRGKPIMRFPK